MAVFTTTDRDNVKTALIEAAVSGVAEVQIGSERVRSYTLDELKKLFDVIQQDLASGSARFGMRMVKTIPPEAG